MHVIKITDSVIYNTVILLSNYIFEKLDGKINFFLTEGSSLKESQKKNKNLANSSSASTFQNLFK